MKEDRGKKERTQEKKKKENEERKKRRRQGREEETYIPDHLMPGFVTLKEGRKDRRKK
jgi:hypothetical protein